uniref:CCR4-NOT transcription complex subunit 3 n=1 Tax=Panagrolaimus sp. JU765 TaxID=591449 RepID=A0AC34QPR1_9BILA
MAEKRKLLIEVEKTYKKVDEGIEVFEETMTKMYEANSENQRDKFQEDLKREIKKLQRLRDLIKGWQFSTDIKDKDKLTQYRKLIESKMEAFKDIERENKTKPHSKQGLSAEEKLDPREKEKSDTIEWLKGKIRVIQDDIDRTDVKMETLLTAATGRKRKGKDDSNKEKIEELKKHKERLNYHVTNLEVCMRLVTNDQKEAKEVMDVLHDALESYSEALDPESDMNPKELDPFGVYEELEIGDFIPQLAGVTTTSIDDEKDETGLTRSATGSPSLDDHKSRNPSTEKPVVPPIAAKVTRTSSNQADERSSLVSPVPLQTPPPSKPYNVAVAAVPSSGAKIITTHMNGPTLASIVKQASSPVPPGIVPSFPSNLSQSSGPPDTPKNFPSVPDSPKSAAEPLQTAIENIGSPRPLISQIVAPPLSTQPPQPMPPPSVSLDKLITSPPGIPTSQQISQQNSENLPMSADDVLLRELANINNDSNAETKTAEIPAWLGVSPLGRVILSAEQQTQIQRLEEAHRAMPHRFDSEPQRPQMPRIPYQGFPSYPQYQNPIFQTLDYYLRLSPETLLFIFYYMEGSKAQLLAAQALKKLSWRFHTKYLMWFQRHEEPKVITDEYEQGSYVYFDFERWAQRKKEQFMFEYRYLEDRDLSTLL